MAHADVCIVWMARHIPTGTKPEDRLLQAVGQEFGHKYHNHYLQHHHRGTSDTIGDSSTSFGVNSRTLLGCTDPFREGRRAPSVSLVSVALPLLLYADVRTFQ